MVRVDWQRRGELAQQWEGPRRPLSAPTENLLNLLARTRATYVWGSALIIVAHLAFHHPDYHKAHALLASVLGVLTFVSAVRMLRAEGHELPLLPWALLQFYIYWGSPVFTEGESLRLFPFSMLRATGAVTASMVGDVLFVSALVVTFLLVSRWLPRRRREPVSTPISQPLLMASAFVALLLSYELIWYERSGMSLFYAATSLFSPTLLHLMLIYERQQHRTPRWFDIGYYLFVAGSVAVGLLSGRMEQALYPIVVAALTGLARTRRLPTRYVAAVVLLMFIMQPIKIVYRDLIGFRTNYYQRLDPAECLHAMGRSFEAGWTGGSAESVYSDNAEGLAERLNERTSNAVVHYLVPDTVPFDRGGTIYPVIYTFIPRLLWAQKPAFTELTNNHFAVRLGFLTGVEARDTTKTVPIAAEAYFNFGWGGTVGVGVVCGFIFAVLGRLFSPSSRLLYVGTFFVLIKLRPYDNLAMVICDSIKPFGFVACWTMMFWAVARFHRGWFAHPALAPGRRPPSSYRP